MRFAMTQVLPRSILDWLMIFTQILQRQMLPSIRSMICPIPLS
jgi:hypothetical protein